MPGYGISTIANVYNAFEKALKISYLQPNMQQCDIIQERNYSHCQKKLPFYEKSYNMSNYLNK